MSTESSFNTDPKPGELTRVFIWCMPRTLSTALIKCLSYVDGIQIFSEPCASAFFFGPEGKQNADYAKFKDGASATQSDISEYAFDDSICTYGWVKQQLEADYLGKKILLVKDHSNFLDAKYEIIPPGFRHAFLIRHPYKVFPSWKRMATKAFNKDPDTTTWKDLAIENPYKGQFELLQYVQKNFDPNPAIIDADDLQSNPSSTLRQLCQAVGIPYSDSLLEWPADREIMKSWIASRILLQGNLLENEGGFYENALRSSRFLPGTAAPARGELQQDIQEIADEAMPFYEKMYQMRIKP